MSRARDRRRAERKAAPRGEELQFGYWFVAFFDLLGIRERYLETDFLPSNDEEKADLIKKLKNSIGVVQGLRMHMARFEAGLNYPGRAERLKALPPNARALAEGMWRVRSTRANISDAIMLACPLAPDDGHFPLRAIYEAFHACASLMLISLGAGHPIRGGLDVGTGLLDGDELFGAAPVKAYRLESQIAQYPRLVVGDTLFRALSDARDQPGSGDRGKVEQDTASRSLGFLKRDDFDDRWILDYAGPEYLRATKGVAGLAELLRAALLFARSQRDEFEQRRDEEGAKLAGRYRALVSYLEKSGPVRVA